MSTRFNETHAGVHVGDWWGQYAPARAVLLAVDLGWHPADRDEVVATAMTKLLGGRYVGLEEVNEARRLAGVYTLENGYEDLYDDHLDTEIEFALDDALDWLDAQTSAGLAWSWLDGSFGLFEVEEPALVGPNDRLANGWVVRYAWGDHDLGMGVVLARNPDADHRHPFATWLFRTTDPATTMQGNYHLDYETARVDFEARALQLGLTPGE